MSNIYKLLFYRCCFISYYFWCDCFVLLIPFQNSEFDNFNFVSRDLRVSSDCVVFVGRSSSDLFSEMTTQNSTLNSSFHYYYEINISRYIGRKDRNIKEAHRHLITKIKMNVNSSSNRLAIVAIFLIVETTLAFTTHHQHISNSNIQKNKILSKPSFISSSSSISPQYDSSKMVLVRTAARRSNNNDDEDEYEYARVGRRRRQRYIDEEEYYEEDDDEFDIDIDEMVSEMDFDALVTIPNPVLDNADPDRATDRLDELWTDGVFWRDISIAGVLFWIWVASSPGNDSWMTHSGWYADFITTNAI